MNKIFLIAIILSFSCFSQTNDSILKNLELKKQKLRMKIVTLNDSIEKIEIAISKVNSGKSVKLLRDSVLEITIKKGGYIKDQASIFGEFIHIFKKQEKVNVIDYKNGYYKVCFGKICGFIN